MTPSRGTVVCLFAMLLFPGACLAGKYGVEQKKGLLLLQGFSQWASFDYEFSSSSSPGNSNTLHDFQERYNFSSQCALVDPRLLQLDLGGSLGLDQTLSYSNATSTKSHELDYQYSLDGSALSGSWHPVSFNSSHVTSTSVSPFAPAYTTSTTNNGIMITFLGKPLVSSFVYQNTSVDTSGSGLSNSTKTEQFSATAAHEYGISATSANAGYTLQTGSLGITTAHYQASLTNTTTFSHNNSSILNSSLQWQQQTSDGVPQTSVDLAERFHISLGKALVSESSYQYHSNDTTDFSGNKELSSSHDVSTSLQHHLFDSLTSVLSAGAGLSDFLGGQEKRFNASLNVQYTKKLSAGANFSLGVSDAYDLVKRNLARSELDVRDEQHTVAQQGDFITLGSSGVLKVVVSVVSKNPDVTYQLGRDYSVDPQLRRITVLTVGQGGTIAPGTVLYVTYSLSVDPSVSFSADSVSLSSTLSWLGGKYALNGLRTQNSVTQLSGQSQSDLNASHTDLLHFQTNLERVTSGVEVGDYVSAVTNYRYLDGFWFYRRQFTNALLSLVAKDRYTVYGGSSSTASYGEDTYSASSSYTRLFSMMQCDLSASYAGSRGGPTSNDYFYLRGGLRTAFNQLSLNLTGQTVYRIRGTQTTMDNSVNLHLVRYF